jgi:hypothetical protein
MTNRGKIGVKIPGKQGSQSGMFRNLHFHYIWSKFSLTYKLTYIYAKIFQTLFDNSEICFAVVISGRFLGQGGFLTGNRGGIKKHG